VCVSVCVYLIPPADADTGAWSNTLLSANRTNLAAASAGTKVLFAGGEASGAVTAVVDLWDATNAAFDAPAALSVARTALSGASVGNKAVFAGGSLNATGGALLGCNFACVCLCLCLCLCVCVC